MKMEEEDADEKTAKKTLSLLAGFCAEEGKCLEEVLRPALVDGKLPFAAFERIVSQQLETDISDVSQALARCLGADHIDFGLLLRMAGEPSPSHAERLQPLPKETPPPGPGEVYAWLTAESLQFTFPQLRERLERLSPPLCAEQLASLERLDPLAPLSAQEAVKALCKKPYREHARDELRVEVEQLLRKGAYAAKLISLESCLSALRLLGFSPAKADTLARAASFDADGDRRLSLGEFERFIVDFLLRQRLLVGAADELFEQLGGEGAPLEGTLTPYPLQLQERHALLLEWRRRGGDSSAFESLAEVVEGPDELLRGLAKLALSRDFGLGKLAEFFGKNKLRRSLSAALLPRPGLRGGSAQTVCLELEALELQSPAGESPLCAELVLALLGPEPRCPAFNVWRCALPPGGSVALARRESLLLGGEEGLALFAEVVLRLPLGDGSLEVGAGALLLRPPWPVPARLDLLLQRCPLGELAAPQLSRSVFLCGGAEPHLSLRLSRGADALPGFVGHRGAAALLQRLLGGHPLPFKQLLNRAVGLRLAALPAALAEAGRLWEAAERKSAGEEALRARADALAAELFLLLFHDEFAFSEGVSEAALLARTREFRAAGLMELLARVRTELDGRAPAKELPRYHEDSRPFSTDDLLAALLPADFPAVPPSTALSPAN